MRTTLVLILLAACDSAPARPDCQTVADVWCSSECAPNPACRAKMLAACEDPALQPEAPQLQWACLDALQAECTDYDGSPAACWPADYVPIAR
jgi:hypothetical protein